MLISKIKRLILIGIGTVAALTALCYVITHSLWFLSGFVPADSNILWAAKSGHPLTQLINTQSGLLGLNLEPEGIYAQDFSHIVIAKAATSTHVVGIANSLFQAPSIQQNLEQKGWHIQAFGPLISAQKGPGVQVLTAKILLSRSGRGMLHVVRHANESMNPIGIIHIAKGSIPLADTTYDAVITKRKDAIQAIIKHPRGQQAPALAPEKKGDSAPNSGLQFALSGKMLVHIPGQLQTASLANIMNNLHIKRKQADLTSLIKTATYIAGVSNDSETGLAIVKETTGLATIMQNIVAAEESYYHPQKAAFRLPDGSIGFELRPGKPSAVWTQINESCSYYQGQEYRWWVCNNSTSASLGTSQEIAQRLLASYDKLIWVVDLGKDLVPANLQLVIQSVKATGTSEETIITIK